MSTDTAGIEAISKVLAQFSDQQNIGAIKTLYGQLGQLGKAMNISSLPILINQLEKLGTITREQAAQLRSMAGPSEFSKKLRDIGKSLGSGDLLGALSKIGPALSSVGGAAGIAVGAIAAAPAAIVLLGKSIESMVAKANPAAAFQFNRALDDLMATMGQMLTPVLNGVTDVVRGLADVMQGLKPTIMLITEAIGDFLKFLGSLLGELSNLMGSRGKSIGAAVRPAAYGSIADIGKRTTLNVLNQGRAPGLTPDGQNTDKKLTETNKLLSDILQRVGVEKSVADKASKYINYAAPSVGAGINIYKWIRQQTDDAGGFANFADR